MDARRLVLGTGAAGLAVQALLFRELMVAMQGSELATGAFFAAWLAWIGAGAAWGRRRGRPERAPALALAVAPAAALQLLGFAHLRVLAGVPAAEVLPLERLVPLALVLEAPTSALVGAVFALAARPPREPGGLYAWEALGSFLGGAGFTLALALGLGPVSAAGVFAVLLALCAAGRRTALPAALVAAAGVGALAGGPAVERALAARALDALLPGAELLAARDTPRARVAVARLGDDTLLVRDGAVAAAWPDERDMAVEAALLAAEMAPGLRRWRVLVLGEGAEELVRALLAFSQVASVDLVVGDPVARRLAEAWLPADTAAALADPRVRLRVADARAVVAEAEPGSWDLVVVWGARPFTAADNRLFTEEFLRAAARALSPAGILATRTAGGANYLGTELSALGASILETMEAAFDGAVVVLPGDPARFVGGNAESAPTADPAQLERRFAALDSASPVPPEAFSSLVEPRRVARALEAYRRPDPAGQGWRNTDEHPAALALAMLVQGRIAGSGWVRLLHRARAAGPWLWWGALLAAALAAGRADRAGRASWAAGAAGLASMGLGIVVLAAFQARVGTLFAEVGLLSALLLAGAAGGAAACRRLPLAPRAQVALQAGATALFAAALPAVVAALPDGPAAAAPLRALAVLAGALTGAGFPAAAALAPPGQAGRLFAADHLGGALGALAAGALALPLLGLGGAAALLAGAELLVLLRLALPEPRVRPAFPFPRAGRLALGLALWALVAGIAAERRMDRPKVRFQGAELEVLAAGGAEALRYEERERPFVHYVALHGEAVAGALAASAAITTDIRGYGGPIDLLVELDRRGRFRRLSILESRETPAYVADVEPWLGGLVGRSVQDSLALARDGGDVEAVTGATISSRAALATAVAAGRALAREALDLDVPEEPPPGAGTPWTAAATAVALGLPLGVAVLLSGSRRLRWALLALSAGVGGAWLNAQASLETLAPLLEGRLPGGASAVLLVGGIALLALGFGAAWCGVLCPFGAALELLGLAGPALAVDRAADRRWRGAKFLVLAVLLVGAALTGERGWLSVDPLGRAFAPSAWTGWSAALLAAAVGLSVAWTRAWCRYLCPLGALVALGNRLAFLRRLVPPRRYARCDFGVAGRRDLDCLQCNRCTWERARPPGPARPHPAPATRALHLALAAALLVLGLALHEQLSAARSGGLGVVRDVDVELYRRLLGEGRLSGHEALYWREAE